MDIILIAIIAFILDCLIGDPHTKYHPVVLMGKLIDYLDKLLRRPSANGPTLIYLGFILVLTVLAVSYGIGYYIVMLLGHLPASLSWINILVQAICLLFMISPKSLAQAGQGVYAELCTGNLDGARDKVNYIVSRDAQRMNEADITRATLETIAENTMDGIIAPLFFFFIGGLPLAILYRAANTMDAMLGYKNDKYLYFGRAAAKLDDWLNLIPARLTGLLFIFTAACYKLDYRAAWKMMRRDAAKHPSPNGGYPEATVAGALGIRLGGLNYYFGHESFREYMGDCTRKFKPADIPATIKLMYGATISGLILGCSCTLIYIYLS